MVLDLALLPARRRRTGDRVDQMMRAHLQEAAIVLPFLADEDRFDRRLLRRLLCNRRVVVDAARASALEEGEGAFVRVEQHLLCPARIGPRNEHPAVAMAHVGDLHRDRHAVLDDDLVAPVELVGFARRKGQQYERRRCRARTFLSPRDCGALDRCIAPLVSKPRSSSNSRISVSRSRADFLSFLSKRASSCSRRGPIREAAGETAPIRTRSRSTGRPSARPRATRAGRDRSA